MTYEHDNNNPYIGDIEQTHSEFATQHGRDGVLVSRVGDKIITVLGVDVGVSDVDVVDIVDEAAAEEDPYNTYEADLGDHHVRVKFTEGGIAPQVIDVRVLDARVGAKGELPQRIVDLMNYDSYVGIEAQLVPVFEAPAEHFEGVHEEFEFSLGGAGQLSSLSPTGAVFRRYYRSYPSETHREDILTRLSENSQVDDAVTVADYSEALEDGSRATWMTDEDSGFWIYERVPFQTPVTTVEALAEELNDIIECSLDLESVVEATPSTEIPAGV